MFERAVSLLWVHLCIPKGKEEGGIKHFQNIMHCIHSKLKFNFIFLNSNLNSGMKKLNQNPKG